MTVSAERPRLVLPGLLPADPQLERYRVQPGAVTAIELDPGDELTVIARFDLKGHIAVPNMNHPRHAMNGMADRRGGQMP